MPFENWFRKDLKDYVLTELNRDGLAQIHGINIDDVSNRISKHMDGSANNYSLIWKLLVLKQWLNNNKGYEIR